MSNDEKPISIIRAKHGTEDPYFRIARALAQDRTISFAARGVMGYLLSRFDHWTLQPKDLQQKCGKNKAYTLINELIGAGYIVRWKAWNTKTKRIDHFCYEVFENPIDVNSDLLPEKLDTGKLDTANGDIIYKRVVQKKEVKEKDLPPAKNADGAVASDNDLSANDNTLIGPVPLCTACNENYEAHYVGVDASNVGTYVCTPCYESPNVHTCTNCGHYRMHSDGDMQTKCDGCLMPDGSGWKMAEETAARLVDECQSAGCILQRNNPLACLDCEGYGLTEKEAQCLRKLPFSETGQQFASNKDNIEPLKNMEFLEANPNGQYSITDLGRKVLAIHDTKPSCQGDELSEDIEQLTAEQAAATGFGMFTCSKCARRLSLETDGWKDTVADPQLCNDCFESQQTTIEIDEPVPAKKPCKPTDHSLMVDAIAAAMGWEIDTITKAVWGKINSTSKQLRGAKCKPENVAGLHEHTANEAKKANWKFDNPVAMVTRWPTYCTLLNASKQQPEAEVEPQPMNPLAGVVQEGIDYSE